MRNVKFTIEYDGTDFHGWQIQPDQRTVQGEIEAALTQIVNKKVSVLGAGRTDQGVHARGQVANAQFDTTIEVGQLQRALNSLTAADLYIKTAEEVDIGFHSRYSAKFKIYRYFIIFEPTPFRLRYTWYIPYRLDMQAMQDTANYVIGTRDFKHFSVRNGKENTECTISKLTLTEQNDQLIISIEGDRFLRKMVRGIVGFLHDVGRGRFNPSQIENALSGDLKDLFFAPPQGLFLMEVTY